LAVLLVALTSFPFAECNSFNDAAHYSKRKQGVVCQVWACAAGMRGGVAPLRAQRAVE
jgi:hypothetical protein